MSLTSLVAASLLLTQAEEPQKPYRFTARVDMVSVPVAVTDKQGNFVKDLRPEDFVVYEDGVKQNIVLFAAGLNESWVGLAPELKEELSGSQVVGLLLDASGSMQQDMWLVREAALKFLANIPKTERLLILDFDENIRLSDYSSDDQRRIADRIYEVEAEGWTALYDVIATFLERVHAESGKKTLVVFSDGVDTRSMLSEGECVDLVKACDVTIHSIHFGSDVTRNPSRSHQQGRFLRRLADLTGGSYALARSLESIDEFYDRILEELFSQYTLGYVSTNTARDSRYRKVTVECSRPGLKLRARQGYVGSSAPVEGQQGEVK